jgi:hypothetical protein
MCGAGAPAREVVRRKSCVVRKKQNAVIPNRFSGEESAVLIEK